MSMWIRAGGTKLCVLLVVCFGVAADGYSQLVLPPYELSKGCRVKLASDFPWHAALYTKTTKPYLQICGSTVVAMHAVITAAHCISRDRSIPPASNFAVAAGKLYRPWNDPHDKGAQKSGVKEIKVPPRYQGIEANFQDDIAVLILTEELKYNEYVRPACVNFNADFEEAQLKEGQLGKVVGWGLTDENSEASQVLQAASLPIITVDTCIEQSPVSFRSAITGDKICAGYTNGTAVCRGDSGGGLVFLAKWHLLELAFLRGVVSTAPTSENKCNIYTWATFTHLLKHEHFLKSVVPDIEKSCKLPPNPSAKVYNFCDTGYECCTCKCTVPYDIEYDGKVFSISL